MLDIAGGLVNLVFGAIFGILALIGIVFVVAWVGGALVVSIGVLLSYVDEWATFSKKENHDSHAERSES